jgi:hypothetical protein
MSALTASPAALVNELHDLANRRFSGRELKRRPSLTPRIVVEGLRVQLKVLMGRTEGTSSFWEPGRVTLAAFVPKTRSISGWREWSLWLTEDGESRWAHSYTQLGHDDLDGAIAAAEGQRVLRFASALCAAADAHGLAGLFQLSRAESCVICGKPLTDVNSIARSIGPDCWGQFSWVSGPDLPDGAGDELHAAAQELVAHG